MQKYQIEPLTQNKIEVLEYIISTQIRWGAGGCFGNGEKIDDKRGLNTAKKLLEIIRNS